MERIDTNQQLTKGEGERYIYLKTGCANCERVLTDSTLNVIKQKINFPLCETFSKWGQRVNDVRHKIFSTWPFVRHAKKNYFQACIGHFKMRGCFVDKNWEKAMRFIRKLQMTPLLVVHYNIVSTCSLFISW